ncbi:hypothetical protein KKA33_02345 [Patescibacteria group bacterium]|nr:hypothetical protein [Patescibacteria group bacterium]
MSIFRKKSTSERLKKPLAKRVQELIRQKEAGIAKTCGLRERLQKKLQSAEKQQTPENRQPNAGNIIGRDTTAPEQAPQTFPAKQPVSDNLEQFQEICKEKAALALMTIEILIGLFRNHIRETNEKTNLLKHLGLDKENLKEMLRAILSKTAAREISRNEIRGFITSEQMPVAILFEKIFKFRKDQNYEGAEMRAELKKLSDAMDPFDEFLEFIETYATQLAFFLYKMDIAVNDKNEKVSVYTQIEWMEEMRIFELPMKKYDENDIETIFNQISQQTVQATRPAVNAALGKEDAGQITPETTNGLEAQRAKQYISHLITIFKDKPDTDDLQQLGLDIDAAFPDGSLGIVLLALKNMPEIETPDQLMREAFGLDDEQEIGDKIQDTYRALKDRFNLDSLA